jgi:hypothetical protein
MPHVSLMLFDLEYIKNYTLKTGRIFLEVQIESDILHVEKRKLIFASKIVRLPNFAMDSITGNLRVRYRHNNCVNTDLLKDK